MSDIGSQFSNVPRQLLNGEGGALPQSLGKRFDRGGRGGRGGHHGRGGGQHMQQHHGPGGHVPMHTGPMTSIVFAGHIGSTKTTNGVIKKHVKTPHSSVFEMLLGHPYLIEGVHIVPNGIGVPIGSGITFEGQTFPTLDERSFTFDLFGRNLDTNEVKLILSINVEGGVQWAPLASPPNGWAIDYIVFSGNFDVVSIIIHGMILESHALTEVARDYFFQGPPFFPDASTHEFDDEDVTDFPVIINDEQLKVTRQKEKDHLRRYSATLIIPVSTLHDKLTGIASAYLDGTDVITKPITLLKKTIMKSFVHSDFLASNDKIASLVGTVYSIDVHKLLSVTDVDEVIRVSTHLGNEIDACYQSSLNSSGDDTYEAFGETIGDETAVIIATLMVKLNTKYLRERHEYSSVASMVDTFHALISTTSLLVVNELTCQHYHSLGGVTLLVDLITISPSLPATMLNEVVECLNRVVIHPNIAIEMFTIPSTIVMVPPKVQNADDDEDVDIWSGDEEEDDPVQHTLTQYEALVSVYSSLSSSSIVLPAYNQLLNYLNLPEACHSLQQLAVSATTKDLPQLIEFVNLLITIYTESGKTINTTTAVVSEDVLPDVETDTVDDNDKIISTCTAIAAAADIIISLLRTVLAVINMDRTCITALSDDRNFLYSLHALFRHTHFCSSVLVFINYMKLLHEAVIMLDWKKGYQIDLLVIRVASLKELLSSLIIRILQLGGNGAELLLDSNVVIHLWETLCKAGTKVDDDFVGDLDNVLMCPSYNEILTAADDKLTLYSLGWAVWFVIYVFGQIEVIAKETEKIKRLGSSSSAVDMQGLSAALECIRDTCYCPLGQSVACRLIGKYCVDNIAFLAGYDSPLGNQASTGLNLIPGAMTESCSNLMTLVLSNMDSDFRGDANLKSSFLVISTTCNSIRGSNLFHMYNENTRECINAISNVFYSTFMCEKQQSDPMNVTERGVAYDPSVLSVDKILDILDIQFAKIVSIESLAALSSVTILFSLLSTEITRCETDALDGLLTHFTTFTSRICTYYRLVTPYLHGDEVEAALNNLYEKNKSYNIPIEAFKYAQYLKNSFDKSAEKPTSEVITRNTRIYLSCIVTFLDLLELALRQLHQSQYRFYYYPIISGIIEMQCLSNSICSIKRAGAFGILVRKINSNCTAIYRQYIPVLTAVTYNNNLHLINYICRRGVQMPMYLPTAMSILVDLMPAKFSSSSRNDAWETYLWSADPTENGMASDVCVSDSILQCDQTSIHYPIGTAKANVMNVIILSLHSSCTRLHKSVVLLCKRLMALGAKSSKMVSSSLCSILIKYSSNVLQNDVTSDNSNHSYNTTIARILIAIDGMCNRGHVCVSLIENGVLHAIFGFLQSQDKDLVLLSLQILSSIFRGVGSSIQKLDNILTHHSSTSIPVVAGKIESIKDALLLVYSGIIDSIIIFLPNVINRFSDTTGTTAAGGISISIWLQSAVLMGMLPMKHLLMFIAALPQSVRIEALAIKIWQAFDDAFQGLIEATETYKGLKDDSTIDKATANYFLEGCKGESVLREAHMQLAVTATALRAIVDATINAFEFGGISMTSLKAALRATMADPKKVGQRIFMTYSNWAMTEAETTVALLSHGLHRTSSSIALPHARLPYATADISECDSYASRHALINQSLLSLQFTLLKASKYVNNKQRPTAKKIIIDRNIDIPVQINMPNPFKGLMTEDAVTHELHLVYNHLQCDLLATLPASSASVYFDAFHSLTRRNLANSSAFINYDPSSYEKVSGYIYDNAYSLHLKACQKVVSKVCSINDEEIRKELQRFGKKQRTSEPVAGGYAAPPGYPMMQGGFAMPPMMHGGFQPMPPFPPPQYR